MKKVTLKVFALVDFVDFCSFSFVFLVEKKTTVFGTFSWGSSLGHVRSCTELSQHWGGRRRSQGEKDRNNRYKSSKE